MDGRTDEHLRGLAYSHAFQFLFHDTTGIGRIFCCGGLSREIDEEAETMAEKRREFIAATKKLRSENPEKFFELYKVHMAVLLELTTEEIENSLRSVPELMKEKSKINSSWLNKSTPPINSPHRMRKRLGSSEFLDAIEINSDTVEMFRLLIDFLAKPENLVEEGLFRKSGSRSREEDLRLRLTSSDDRRGRTPILEDGSVNAHDCASVMKKLLRSLPQPLLLAHHFHIYQKNADFAESEQCESGVKESRKARRLDVVRLLIMLLPLENKKILKMVLSLLNDVSEKKSVNRMDALNLATVFVPCILIPDTMSPEEVGSAEGNLSLLLELMILHYKELFLPPQKFIMDVLQELDMREKGMEKEEGVGVVGSSIRFADQDRQRYDGKEYTALAMAELYASIASMPEGQEKQRRLKQVQKHSRENVRTPEKGMKMKAVGARIVKSVKKKLTGGRSAKYEPSDSLSLQSYDSGISSENFVGIIPGRHNRSCDGLDSVSDYSSLTIESSKSWDYYPAREHKTQTPQYSGNRQTTRSKEAGVKGVLPVLSQL